MSVVALFRDPKTATLKRLRNQNSVVLRGRELDALSGLIARAFDELRGRLRRMPVSVNEVLLDQVMRLEQNMVLLVGDKANFLIREWNSSWRDECAPVVTPKYATYELEQVITNLCDNLKTKIKDHSLIDLSNRDEGLVLVHLESLVEDLLIRLRLLINGWV